MPWKVTSAMTERHEFVLLASAEGANLRQLCRRFGISPTTGYKWLRRYRAAGAAGLPDRSRRPGSSPRQTSAPAERAICALRRQHPAWGGRKLRARLLALGRSDVPSASTITALLRRHQLLDPAEVGKHAPFIRFEHAAPNDLWQMDFKGDFALARGRCYPLTVLDDHSRFALGLRACADEQTATVQQALTQVFRRYGLPYRMTMDNGAPWAVYRDQRVCYTALTVWLLRLGIRVSHSRPRHPQTQGKDERFHRTLALELLRDHRFRHLAQCQPAFDRWRQVYNTQRPHEALGLEVPAARYQPSPRPFPERLPAIEYAPGEVVRKVQQSGQIKYGSRKYFVGHGFRGLHVALRPTTSDGVWAIVFCQQQIGTLDLHQLSSEP